MSRVWNVARLNFNNFEFDLNIWIDCDIVLVKIEYTYTSMLSREVFRKIRLKRDFMQQYYSK